MKLIAGSKAPEFTIKDQDGKDVTLSSFKGKKIVLYFYPKDLTPTCTTEACNLRDNYKALQKAGYEVLGVSTDNEKSHRKFIQKEKLPFRLLADIEKSLHEKYGTWVEKSMYGRKYMGTARTTFLIDEAGKISKIIDNVDSKNHTAQILGEPEISQQSKVKKNKVKKVSAKTSNKKTPNKIVRKKK